MFAHSGINIDVIPSDTRYQPNPDDQNTDLDKIVSHEGTPQSGDAAVLYTYVAMQEAKGDASPRRGSDGHSSHNRRTKSAQNTPSPGSMAIHAEGQAQILPIHQKSDAQMSPNVQAYAPQHQYSNSQSSTLPCTQGFEQQSFNSTAGFRRQSTNAMGAQNFMPLSTVPEGSNYQAQTPASGISYRTMSASDRVPAPDMDGYGNMSGMIGTEMDVDGMNLWWDQSYGTFDIEVTDPNVNANADRGKTYQFQDFSSGY